MKKVLGLGFLVASLLGCAIFFISRREDCADLNKRKLQEAAIKRACYQIIGPQQISSSEVAPISVMMFLVCAEDVYTILWANEEDVETYEEGKKRAEEIIGQCKVRPEGKDLPITIMIIPNHANMDIVRKGK